MIDGFVFHGVIFHTLPETGDAQGDCPFCGKEKHFGVNVDNGLWNCFRCGESGNFEQFLGAIHEQAIQETTPKDYDRLSMLRWRAAPPEAYKHYMLAWNGTNWLLPIFGEDGNLVSVRIWKESGGPMGGKSAPWINTKGVGAHLWGLEKLNNPKYRKCRVDILEGEWDGIALGWQSKIRNAKSVVLAVPGAGTFKKEWYPLFNDRDVVMAYDADVAGDNGMKSKGDILRTYCRSLQYIRWPLDVKEGYDVSDHIINTTGNAWDAYENLISAAPRMETLVDRRATKPKLKPGARPNFDKVVEVYKHWLDMPEDSVMALRVIKSVILSNQLPGDPLWTYIVAPPGGGKTALLNPLRALTDHCVFRSNLTATMLISGWQGAHDPSLIPKLNGKTLVLKDLTELLAAPMHEQEGVFGVLRGAHDGYVERSYGNQVMRRYESRFSMIAGVTVKIHGHSQASMGEKVLKFQLVPGSRTNHETTIRKAMFNLGNEDKMEAELSEVASAFLDQTIDKDELKSRVPSFVEDRIVAIAQLIARLRLEVERDNRGDQVQYRPQPEIGTRLAKALFKLAMLLTLTFGEGDKWSGDEWKIIERVAFDTAIGWNLDVIAAFMKYDSNGGLSRPEIVRASGLPASNVTRRLDDLLFTGAISREEHHGEGEKFRYKLIGEIRDLWERSTIQRDDQHSERINGIRRFTKSKLRPRRPNYD